jgi:hypothetical protein
VYGVYDVWVREVIVDRALRSARRTRRGSGTFCAVCRIGSDITAPTFDLRMCLRQFDELSEHFEVKVLASYS